MNVGPFQLIAPLAASHACSRYQAFDDRIQCPCEVRILRRPAEMREWASLVKRCKLSGMVVSDGARRITDFEATHDPPYLAMAGFQEERCLLEQRSDGDEGSTGQPMILAAAWLDALVAAHRLGLVHGRLSPAEIVGEGEVWLLDFTGLAPAGPQQLDHPVVRACRPPEDDSGSDLASPAADVFAWAAILHWLLTGRSWEPSAAARSELADRLEQVTTLPDASRSALVDLLESALSDDPELRPTAREAADLLGRILKTSGPPATGATEAGFEQTMEVAPDLDHIHLAATVVDTTVPQQLGRFRVLEMLGQGGMGAVYRAEDVTDQTTVAIKVLSAELAANARSRQRFSKEARLLAQVNNPYVTNLIEFNDDEGLHYLVLEFVPGRSVGELLAQKGRLDERVALAIMSDVGRALQVAHGNGIVHRDIKPDNILLTEAGAKFVEAKDAAAGSAEILPIVKLSDFGLARNESQSESLAITQAGVLLGTPYYMPPEQCQGQPADARSDVYSMGATMFHFLAGRPPFEAETRVAVIAQHCNDPPPKLRQIEPDLSEAIERVVDKALAKNPDARYPHAEALLEDLEKLRSGEATSLAVHPKLPERRDGVLEYEFVWELDSSPAQLWPHVSNTDRLNHAMGLPAARFTSRLDPDKGMRRFAEARIAGYRIAWEEHAFEWIEGRRMSVLREFTAGPFSWFVNVVELIPRGGGACLRHKVMLLPRNWIGRLIARIEIGVKSKRSLGRIYQQIDDYVSGNRFADPAADAFRKPAPLSARRRATLQQRLAALRDESVDPAILETLGQFLEFASDQEVSRLRPLAFADRFGLDKSQVVTACLQAVRHELLVLLWDILCPSCRIPSDVKETLAALGDHGHCEACNVDFELDFANSVELIFRAHPEIRDAEVRTYCVGGPAFSSHVVAQLRVAPDERVEMDLALAEGAYRLRGPQLPFEVPLKVARSAREGKCQLPLSRPRPAEMVPALKTGAQVITVVNDCPKDVLVRLERTASRHDALTAGEASSWPLFREFFPEQVLSPGQMVSVATVSFLMIRIDQSPQLYASLGDGAAFSIIREALVSIEDKVMQEGGAVVKIVDEGMTTSFSTPLAALRAALCLRAALDASSQTADLNLRMSIHRGAALVATLNERLDYFGTTVHVASHLLELAPANGLLLTEEVAGQADVSELLHQHGLHREVLSDTKGLSQIIHRCRLDTSQP